MRTVLPNPVLTSPVLTTRVLMNTGLTSMGRTSMPDMIMNMTPRARSRMAPCPPLSMAG